MKIYLDYQIWDYICKNSDIKEFFEQKREQNGWRYFISVAHLEEIYRARKNENDKTMGMTDALEKTIRLMAEDGVIKPTYKGLQFIAKSYEKTYNDVKVYDTEKIVKIRSIDRKQMDKNAYNPQNLFEGKKHEIKDEYKLVWETDRVQKEVKNISFTFSKIRTALLMPNNSIRKDLIKAYGEEAADQQILRMLNSYDIEVKPGMYQSIRNDYGKLEAVMEQLFFSLTRCGFKRDGSDKHANSGTYDIQHAICATMCDEFITNDDRFADKYMAVAYFLGIPIKIHKWSDFKLPVNF